jgi:hypothetical protein
VGVHVRERLDGLRPRAERSGAVRVGFAGRRGRDDGRHDRHCGTPGIHRESFVDPHLPHGAAVAVAPGVCARCGLAVVGVQARQAELRGQKVGERGGREADVRVHGECLRVGRGDGRVDECRGADHALRFTAIRALPEQDGLSALSGPLLRSAISNARARNLRHSAPCGLTRPRFHSTKRPASISRRVVRCTVS